MAPIVQTPGSYLLSCQHSCSPPRITSFSAGPSPAGMEEVCRCFLPCLESSFSSATKHTRCLFRRLLQISKGSLNLSFFFFFQFSFWRQGFSVYHLTCPGMPISSIPFSVFVLLRQGIIQCMLASDLMCGRRRPWMPDSPAFASQMQRL